MYTSLFILFGKAVSYIIKQTNLGNGSTWPGHIALKYNPNFIKDILNKNPSLKVVIVAGTNGKTTTSLMIHHILEKSGKRVFQNGSGANLLSGIASTLIAHDSISGKIQYDFAIFEVDENALPHVLKQITPDVLVLLNLFRDQLDRYGEVNSIQKRWEDGLKLLRSHTNVTLVANADDPRISFLGQEASTPVKYFGVKGKHAKLKEDASDSLFCPKCDSPLVYKSVVYSHMGDWRCNACGLKRSDIDLEALSFYPLDGTYNKYNTHAAVLTAGVLGVTKKQAEESLKTVKPAFGRQEIIQVGQKYVQLFLSKNPASFNQSLETIMRKRPKSLLFVLNDRIPDGKDVSWIYDTNIESFNYDHTAIFASGDRAYDMGVRLKYAHPAISHVDTISDLNSAIENALRTTAYSETLYVLPTYSAMLDMRKILTGRKIL